MRPIQASCRHGEDEVRDLDAVERVCVEDCDPGRHRNPAPPRYWKSPNSSASAVMAASASLPARLQAASVREHVDEPQAPMRADQVVRDLTGLDLLDEVRAADIEQPCSLDRRRLGVQWDDRHAVA